MAKKDNHSEGGKQLTPEEQAEQVEQMASVSTQKGVEQSAEKTLAGELVEDDDKKNQDEENLPGPFSEEVIMDRAKFYLNDFKEEHQEKKRQEILEKVRDFKEKNLERIKEAEDVFAQLGYDTNFEYKMTLNPSFASSELPNIDIYISAKSKANIKISYLYQGHSTGAYGEIAVVNENKSGENTDHEYLLTDEFTDLSGQKSDQYDLDNGVVIDNFANLLKGQVVRKLSNLAENIMGETEKLQNERDNKRVKEITELMDTMIEIEKGLSTADRLKLVKEYIQSLKKGEAVFASGELSDVGTETQLEYFKLFALKLEKEIALEEELNAQVEGLDQQLENLPNQVQDRKTRREKTKEIRDQLEEMEDGFDSEYENVDKQFNRSLMRIVHHQKEWELENVKEGSLKPVQTENGMRLRRADDEQSTKDQLRESALEKASDKLGDKLNEQPKVIKEIKDNILSAVDKLDSGKKPKKLFKEMLIRLITTQESDNQDRQRSHKESNTKALMMVLEDKDFMGELLARDNGKEVIVDLLETVGEKDDRFFEKALDEEKFASNLVFFSENSKLDLEKYNVLDQNGIELLKIFISKIEQDSNVLDSLPEDLADQYRQLLLATDMNYTETELSDYEIDDFHNKIDSEMFNVVTDAFEKLGLKTNVYDIKDQHGSPEYISANNTKPEIILNNSEGEIQSSEKKYIEFLNQELGKNKLIQKFAEEVFFSKEQISDSIRKRSIQILKEEGIMSGADLQQLTSREIQRRKSEDEEQWAGKDKDPLNVMMSLQEEFFAEQIEGAQNLSKALTEAGIDTSKLSTAQITSITELLKQNSE